MGVVLLAVSSDYSSSGITDQGSSDSIYQSEVGIALPCPGVFPCRIASTSRVGGTSTSVVAQVYAGSNHLLIQEYLHNATAYAGNSVRTETIHKSLKIVGGTFTEDPTTVTPVIAPYYSVDGLLSTSLTGISANLGSLSLTGYPIIATNISTPGNATASNNYYTFKDEFNKKPNLSYLRDGAHFFLETPIPTTSQFISINLSSKRQDPNANFRATNSTADLRSYNSVQMLPFPIISNGTDLIDRVTSLTTTRAQKVTANLLITIRNTQGLRCFNPTSSPNTYGGVDLKPGVSGEEATPANKILALAIYDSEPRESTAPDEVDGFYTFAGIRADGSPFLGMFAQPLANPAAHFFQTGWQQNILYSGLRPAFGYDSTLRSVDNRVPAAPRVNSYWAGAYPVGARFNTYSDVQSTQYGFVFLNSVTKHLEFLFKPYFESGNVSPTLGVINKLLHPPPRSVDYIPAVNMKLGISPLDPTGLSVYKTNVNNGLVEGYFAQSSMLHGGGGHLMAMGTFNGALIHQGRVVVWGSNRWGQCVIPTPITAANITLVDVAVANSPPVLVKTYDDSIYSDSMAEFKARDYTKPDTEDPSYGADPYYYSYPPIHQTRHGRHINYTNLPGHVVVVTAAGWVYAWGNNKYNQCDVPDDISLIAADGSARNDTNVPTDPISEVSAGAFHTVARSRAGRLYVWGAGNPNTTISATSDGRVTTSSLADVYPTTDGSAAKKVSKCVHFGQSTLWVSGQSSLGSGGLATPTATPIGLSSLTSEDYPASGLTAVYGATTDNVTEAKKTINSISTVVGHQTAAGFCPTDTAALRCKGLIAAGAFHTAVIDSALKIQCVGAGRGPVENTSTGILFDAVVGTDLKENTAQWGSSYTTGANPYQFSSTYPHYCQGLNQYQAPFPTAASPNTNPHLFRYPNAVTPATPTGTEIKHLLRFFQDVTFKKVTCGPFTTHGIVHGISRVSGTTEMTIDSTWNAHMNGKVMSWGLVHSPRGKYHHATGPTGITNLINSSYTGFDATVTLTALHNPVGTICGAGAVENLFDTSPTPRYFELLNRPVGTGPAFGMSAELLAPEAPGDVVAFSVGAIGASYNSACPVTISRFKVKDVASCGDYTVFIGRCNTGSTGLGQTSVRSSPSDQNYPTGWGTPFNYESSVFFTGADYYNAYSSASTTVEAVHSRMQADNPYSGSLYIKRNKLLASTPVDDRFLTYAQGYNISGSSTHFGLISTSVTAAGALVKLASTDTPNPTSYLLPTSAFASNNMTVAIVNMDNRPIAWKGQGSSGAIAHEAPIDLSLLPSVPIKSFKAGVAHIVAVADGDWPVALSLKASTSTPKLVTELTTQLFSNTQPTIFVAPNLISGETARYFRPVLIAWGAGDGREYGTDLLYYGPPGLGTTSAYGKWFLDTHAVSRHETASTPNALQAQSDLWNNYYGHYRWNVYNSHNDTFNEHTPTPILGFSAFVASGTPVNDLGLKKWHPYVEAMQSMLGFKPADAPTNFSTIQTTFRPLLNGLASAGIPAGALRPFVDFSTVVADRTTVCCTTAAETASSAAYSSINSQQEYNSTLSYTRQSYSDYVVDYAVGAMHSAVLFSSTCAVFSNVANGQYKNSIALFDANFGSLVTGAVHFGQRRICKVGIVGYGCDNQTAGKERILNDGSIAPVVPELFSRKDAKVYCGDSYTLVTNPVKIHTFGSTQAMNLIVSGSGYASHSRTFTPTTAQRSKRIRGFDITLTFSAPTAIIPLSSLIIKVAYKERTYIVLSRPKAGANLAKIAAGVATTIRVSDRFNPTNAYSYSGTSAYDESGNDPTAVASYTFTTPNYYLNGTLTTAPVAISKQGCYYPASVAVGTGAVTYPTWPMETAIGGIVQPFDSDILVTVEDYSNIATSYGTNLTITLDVEVDAYAVPYVLYGPARSGVFNEIQGLGPSFVTDIDSFTSNNSIFQQSCPCEVAITPPVRLFPKSFPVDSRFICGTKKYGPAGNRENLAANVDNGDGNGLIHSEPGWTTANFFNIFTSMPFRPMLSMAGDVKHINAVMQVLPPAAILAPASSEVPLLVATPAIALRSEATNPKGLSAYVGLISRTSCILNVIRPELLTPMFSYGNACNSIVRPIPAANVKFFVGLKSGCP